MSDKKTKVADSTPAPASPEPPAKRADATAPFIEGGTYTDGKRVSKTKDPERAKPRAPRKRKRSGGERSDD